MKAYGLLLATAATALLGFGVSPSVAQVLYTEDFQADATAEWTVNGGPTDETADFFYDYGLAAGIPLAPNSAPASPTRGMKLTANLVDAIFGGFSVSPTGQSFTGDYVLKFDWWHNYLGGDPAGVGVIGSTTGSTMLSTFGIESSGAAVNYPGAADSIYFAGTGDVSSSAFRAYSSERNVSYQLPHNATILDGVGQPIDSHATHAAGTRSNNPATGGGLEVYYQTAFPSVAVPAAQTALFPETQHGSTVAGSSGFAWHEVEIARVGESVTWTVDGTLLITLDTTNYVGTTGGTNILFGHSDINASVSLDPYYQQVAFTLIDNIVVEEVGVAPDDADFDGDGDVDGQDFLTWQRGLGTMGDKPDGNANGDNTIDAADLAIWKAQFGPGTPAALAAAAVPEPSTWAMAALACAACLALAAPPRRIACARTKVGT
ncbi:MAG: hypothetical protein H0T51_11535 [Pirellulales bacterium]|nr:hypothetical protein [Pirellulales bacterium]